MMCAESFFHSEICHVYFIAHAYTICTRIFLVHCSRIVRVWGLDKHLVPKCLACLTPWLAVVLFLLGLWPSLWSPLLFFLLRSPPCRLGYRWALPLMITCFAISRPPSYSASFVFSEHHSFNLWLMLYYENAILSPNIPSWPASSKPVASTVSL